MSIMKPLGARILVRDEVPEDEVTARAKASGLYIATLEENKPKPTTGIVVAIGTDPEVQEHIHEGDRVFFAKHSGSYITIRGEQFRSLDFHEIITVESGLTEGQKEE